MKKTLLITVGMFAILAICWHLLISSFKSDIQTIETKVGTRVVIEKDTLMVIDYSFWNDNYTLSNGMEISSKLTNKLEIVK